MSLIGGRAAPKCDASGKSGCNGQEQGAAQDGAAGHLEGNTGQMRREEQANWASGPRAAAESEVEQKLAPSDEGARQNDAEDALVELERLLQSWTPSNPPRKVPTPDRNDGSAAPPVPRVETQAAQIAQAIAAARPLRRLLTASLLGLAAATAIAAVFALDGAPGLMERPQPIAPAVPPTAGPRPSDGSVAGSAAAGSPLLKGAALVKGAASETPPAGQNVLPATSGNVPPASTHAAGPAGNASSSADAREPAPEASPHPQAFNSTPGQPSAPPSREAPNAAPAPSALPAVGSVKAPAEPEPKAADEAALGAQRLGSEPPATQSGDQSGLGEDVKPNPIALAAAPLPPIRPASLGKPRKHEKTAKPHKEAKAADEPAAPPPADEPETPAAQPAGNPLLRLFAAPSSDEPRPSAPAAR